MSETIEDETEARARALHTALLARGIRCNVHWDRSPWGVRIPLVEAPASPTTNDDILPALFVLTEGTTTIAGHTDTWLWTGQLGDFDDDGGQDVLIETFFEWVERSWAGEDVGTVADALVAITGLLKVGATVYLRTVSVTKDDGQDPAAGPPRDDEP